MYLMTAFCLELWEHRVSKTMPNLGPHGSFCIMGKTSLIILK